MTGPKAGIWHFGTFKMLFMIKDLITLRQEEISCCALYLVWENKIDPDEKKQERITLIYREYIENFQSGQNCTIWPFPKLSYRMLNAEDSPRLNCIQ